MVPARMVIVILVLWVALGLGVFLVAMRGGPRGARAALHTEAKGGQRVLLTIVVAAFVFGLAVPAFVIADNSSDKASVAVGGVILDASQQKGRELFSHGCNLCHTLAAANAVARTGPDLDLLIPEVAKTDAGRKAFVLSAILEGRARGKGSMPAQLYRGKEAEDVASFVAAVAGH